LVTPSLYDAFKHLRKEDEELFIWADALRINQEDKLEKNHQVGMMAQTYKRCDLVFAWFGGQHNPRNWPLLDLTIPSQVPNLGNRRTLLEYIDSATRFKSYSLYCASGSTHSVMAFGADRWLLI